MTIKIAPIVIRVMLTMLLVWGVYTETGPFTALSIFLIFVAIEALGFMIGDD